MLYKVLWHPHIFILLSTLDQGQTTSNTQYTGLVQAAEMAEKHEPIKNVTAMISPCAKAVYRKHY